MKPKFIFLDLGDVTFRYLGDTVAYQLGQLADKDAVEVKQLLGMGFDHYPQESVMYCADAGLVGKKRLVKSIRRCLAIPSDISNGEIRRAFVNNSVEFQSETSRVLCMIRKQFFLGIISNTNPLHWEYTCGIIPLLSETSSFFSFHVLSFREKLMKPDRRFFESAFHKAEGVYDALTGKGLKPDECFCLDDKEDNVSSMRGYGLHAERVYEPGHKGIVDAMRRGGVEASFLEVLGL